MGERPMLKWDAPKSTSELEGVWYYIVYACDYKSKVLDQYDASRIVYVGQDTEYIIPESENPLHFKYIVTAVNRMQNESEASQVCVFNE
jgi:hypothetical protein